MHIFYRIVLFFIVLFSFLPSFSQKKEQDKNDKTYTYIEAIRHKVFGNLPQAAYLFKKISELDTTCASCFYELSGIFYSGGDVKNGFPYAEKAYKLDPTNYWYAKNYADYLRYISEWDKAVVLYKSLIKFKETSVEDTFYYAESLLNAGKAKEGLDIINKIEGDYGISERFILLKYKYYFNNRDYNKAVAELNKLMELEPKNVLYYGMKAELYGLQDKKNEALAAYKILFDSLPYYVNAHISLGKFYLDQNDTSNAYKTFNFVLNDTNFSKKDKIDLLVSFIKEKDKKRYYENYIVKYVNSYLDKNDSIAAYREVLCDFYENRNDYETALKYAESLVNIGKINKNYWDRYFYYLNILKKYDTILENEKIVYELLSDRPFTLFISGLAAYIKEKPEKSIQFLQKGLDVSQNNKVLSNQMLNLIAENYYKIKKPDSAFYYYELAISEGDEDITMYNNYAYFLAVEGKDLDKALNLSRITIDQDPKNATFLDTYAWILFRLKLYNEAFKYIKLAYKYDKRGSAEMTEHYGDILFCKGKKDQAKKYWKKAAEMSNSDPRILNKMNSYVCP